MKWMPKKTHVLFVGERRSKTAIKRGWHWKDKRLAAKQLFDMFDYIGFEHHRADFCNLFEEGGRATVMSALLCGKPIVAMGQKVHAELSKWCIIHYELVHPAARGAIRDKRLYAEHGMRVLGRFI